MSHYSAGPRREAMWRHVGLSSPKLRGKPPSSSPDLIITKLGRAGTRLSLSLPQTLLWTTFLGWEATHFCWFLTADYVSLNSSLLFLDLSCLHNNLCPYSFFLPELGWRWEGDRSGGRRDQPITQGSLKQILIFHKIVLLGLIYWCSMVGWLYNLIYPVYTLQFIPFVLVFFFLPFFLALFYPGKNT